MKMTAQIHWKIFVWRVNLPFVKDEQTLPQIPQEATVPSVDCQFRPAPSFHLGQDRIPPQGEGLSGNNFQPHPVNYKIDM